MKQVKDVSTNIHMCNTLIGVTLGHLKGNVGGMCGSWGLGLMLSWGLGLMGCVLALWGLVLGVWGLG
jgi:hypothetical protein